MDKLKYINENQNERPESFIQALDFKIKLENVALESEQNLENILAYQDLYKNTLEREYIEKKDIINNLDTDIENMPLSASMGKKLNDSKVTKELNKTLSSNDYTNIDKQKVDVLQIGGLGDKFLNDKGEYLEIYNLNTIELTNTPGQSNKAVMTQKAVTDLFNSLLSAEGVKF